MIVGITTVRDEADVIEDCIRHHLAEGVDHIIVADNLSTDGTTDILRTLSEELPVTYVADKDPGHRHGEKMTRLARQAHDMGADWVLPFDADEFFYSDHGTIVEALQACPDDLGVLACDGFDHIATRDGLSDWRKPDPQPLPKCLFRSHPDAVVREGQHGVDHPLPQGTGPIRYRHFQYRSFDHFVRKVRNGAKAADLAGADENTHSHWRHFAAMTDVELKARWLIEVSQSGLVFDPPPIRRERSVSVVIPTLDREDLLGQCRDALRTTAPGVEVLVERDENRDGFAATCNRAAKEASGDILVFLNDDTIPQPGWVEALTRRIGWGVVGALLTYPDGTVQHSGVFLRRNGVLEAFNSHKLLDSGEVPAVTGACLAVTRELWDQLGGFDEGFRNGYEDVDLCLRARDLGARPYLAADCRVVHLESQSDQSERFGHAAQNIDLLQQRWGDLRI